MEIKNFKTKFIVDDADEEKGVFVGHASVWDVIDDYGECVDRGAFKKTIKETKHFPICWSHDLYQPMGISFGEEDDIGLKTEGHLNMDVQLAREKRSLMIQGAINGLSIGFKTVKDWADNKTGIRHLKEIKLYEISPCVFQACPGALVEEIKSLDFQSLRTIDEAIKKLRIEGLADDSKALLYEARLSINALLGQWEPDTSTPDPGKSQNLGKSEIFRLLEGFMLTIEQARKNL